MKRLIPRFAAALLVTGLLSGRAAIVTDGSLGASGPLTGPNFAVPASLGKISGGNLFHSFSEFNIATGESATFSGPSEIQNILARVTAGGASLV